MTAPDQCYINVKIVLANQAPSTHDPHVWSGRALQEDAPSNASELVGEALVLRRLLGRLEPRLEPVTIPALRLDQYNPCGLNEQNAQVAIAALRYLAEDGAVAGRDLLGDEPQPSGEVAAFRERIAGAD